MTALVVLQKMIMLVILMLIGVGCAKAGWLNAKFSQMASLLVVNVFMSALIVSSVCNVELTMTNREMLLAEAAAFVTFFISAAMGWLAGRLFRLEGHTRTVAFLSIFFMNNVFIGFPVIDAIFGPDAIFCASLSNIPFNLLLYSVGVAKLRAGDGRGRVKIREVFTAPMIATFIAIVIFLFRVPVPMVVADTLSALGAATVPMSMVIIGISLSSVPMKTALTDWRAYGVSLVRLVVCPLVTWLVLRLFLPVDGLALGVMTVIGACPSAALITILSVRYGADDTFASRVNFVSTILCAVTLPVISAILL